MDTAPKEIGLIHGPPEDIKIDGPGGLIGPGADHQIHGQNLNAGIDENVERFAAAVGVPANTTEKTGEVVQSSDRIEVPRESFLDTAGDVLTRNGLDPRASAPVGTAPGALGLRENMSRQEKMQPGSNVILGGRKAV